MTRLEIAVVACKLAALAMTARAVAAMSGATGMLFVHHESLFDAFWTSQFVPLAGAGWLIAGFYVWHNAGRLAEGMVDAGDDSPAVSAPFRPDELLSLGAMVIGLFLILPAVRTLLVFAAEAALDEETLDQWWDSPYWRSQVVGALIEIGCGVWLLLGSRGVRRLVLRMRGMDDGESTARDVEPPPSPQSPESSSEVAP